MRLGGTLIAIVLACAALGSCSEEGSPGALVQRPATSACGGFFAGAKSPLGDPATYCDAEMLWWAYDAATGMLTLANNRIELNCCGDHSIAVTLEEGVYVVTERDAPEFADARCGCMCVWDFDVEVDDIPNGVIDVRLVRNVTDGGGPRTVWTGSLDLTLGTGSVTIDAGTAEPWCSSAAT